MKKQDFQQFLLESFRDGVYKRELRLSKQEVEMIRQYYPSASVVETGKQKQKAWYEVRLIAKSKQTQ
ncbi:hypothetical protein [Halobacillus salinus]|uniref:Uncharacterized protein n=1 Tax=Halobacillus salinus TaxID=192814 RepID=A0A4Z0GYC1_9BACI|nr:hypothetical protein [Halobacillus salinus]TGB02858.1 hypothetical protein E4663_11955 [Halobacillus salinus]